MGEYLQEAVLPVQYDNYVFDLYGTCLLYTSLSKGLNFMDMDMETNQLSVTISAKEGEKLTFEELTQASDDVIQRISKIKGIKTVGAMAGGDSTMNLMGCLLYTSRCV